LWNLSQNSRAQRPDGSIRALTSLNQGKVDINSNSPGIPALQAVDDSVESFSFALFGIIGLIGGAKIGYRYRCRSDYLYARSLLVHLFPLLTVVLFIVLSFIGISTLLTFGLFILYLGVIVISFHFARCRDSLEGVALCRNLVAARRYFKKQLNRNNPALKDEWFPYLLAFGLGPNIDAWTERFGRTAGYGTTSSTDPAILADSGSYGFSGGGGDFGGAGACGD